MNALHRFVGSLALASFVCTAGPAAAAPPAVDLERLRVVDLTHPFDEQTIYWPNSPDRFRHQRLAWGQTPGGYFYAAGALSAPEHGGTHLDAPVHFSATGQTAAEIPVERLVAPACVIDIRELAAADPDYRLTVADVRAFESAHGVIPRGAIVLLRSLWSARWPDRKAYLGDDTPGDASHLHFPGFGAEAARLLVEERAVAGLGIDTASIDHGPSQDFIVHRIAAARNVFALENLSNLDALPPTGAVLVALPMKIAGGSGGPLRAIALVKIGDSLLIPVGTTRERFPGAE